VLWTSDTFQDRGAPEDWSDGSNELLRTSRFPSVVLAQASFMTKPGLGEGRAGMNPGPAPVLATVSFWTWVLPVLRFRHTVERRHRLS